MISPRLLSFYCTFASLAWGLTWQWRCRSWPASGWSRQILPAGHKQAFTGENTLPDPHPAKRGCLHRGWPLKGTSSLNIRWIYTYHPADGATDGVGLKLTVEAPSHLVHLREAEQQIKSKHKPWWFLSSGGKLIWMKKAAFSLKMIMCEKWIFLLRQADFCRCCGNANQSPVGCESEGLRLAALLQCTNMSLFDLFL